MSEPTVVNGNGCSSSNEMHLAVLTCAVIVSRQTMTPEVQFPIRIIDRKSETRRRVVNLDISENAVLGTLLTAVAASAAGDVSDGSFSNEEWAQLSYTDGEWHFQCSKMYAGHASPTEATFHHVFSQLAKAAKDTAVSHIETVRNEDIQWLGNNSIHSIPPPKATNGDSMFAEGLTQWPEQVAIDAWDGSFTYAELDQTATRLAHVLVAEGVGSGMIVPLVFEFSKWVPVAILGIWKAGAAFVFLDPTHPVARLQTLIDQVQAIFVLAPQALHDRIPKNAAKCLILEEVVGKDVPFQSLHPATPESLAYVLFTSGSSGTPKAVPHTHLAFCSGVLPQAQVLGFSRSTRTLENGPLIFAGAVAEILFTLCSGGCLCIPRQEDRIHDLSACVRRFDSNLIVMSPSSAAVRDPTDFAAPQTVILGSEPLPERLAKAWASVHDCRHGYGSSESNTVATGAVIRDAATIKSVGSGTAHQYWVVDPLNHARLLPPGWLGEIVVESHALALGYLRNEEATQKAFLAAAPKWHSALGLHRPGSPRFFASGDLGCIACDGSLEVHGRLDTLQVKLRGQRVELGEIEVVTQKGLPERTSLMAELVLPKSSSRPSVAIFIVATSFVDNIDETLLARHVSLTAQQQMQLSRLKTMLRKVWSDTLPEFMRPSFLIPLQHIPRTGTGKVDRQQLRRWSSQFTSYELRVFSMSAHFEQVPKPNVTASHPILRASLEHVLGLPQDAVEEDVAFSALGGDSLHAIQLSHEMRRRGYAISPADIIRSESLAALAASMRSIDPPKETIASARKPATEYANEAEILSSLGLEKSHVQGVLPTTDSQSRAIKSGTGPERCFVFHFALKFQHPLNKSRLVSAAEGLVDRHDILRTIFTRQGDKIVQIVLKATACPLEALHCTDERSLEDAVRNISQSDIALDRLPTFFWLLMIDNAPKALVLRLSHAQFDGVSTSILWDNFARLCEGYSLPPAPRYSDYAQAVLQDHTAIASAKLYFENLLRDCPFTDLVQRPAELAFSPQNRHLHRRLALSIPTGFTPAHFFEAAWAHVLARNSGTNIVSFDHIVSGRQIRLPDGSNVAGVVGPCLNDVPVVVTFRPSQTVQELVVQIREQHAETSKHETLGFRTILDECKPTHWPENARMTSSVQYRGFEGANSFQVGGTECKVDMIERSMDLEDLTVLVTPIRPRGSGEFEVEFLFSSDAAREDWAERRFEELVRNIECFNRKDVFNEDVLELLGVL